MVQLDHLGPLGLMAALAIAASAAGADPTPGDPARGAEVALDFQRGNCTICHAIPGLGIPEEGQGNIGPSLDGIGGRRSAAELRAILTDPRALFPDTIMPAYGVADGLIDVADPWQGRPILSPQEIADLASYLEGLR